MTHEIGIEKVEEGPSLLRESLGDTRRALGVELPPFIPRRWYRAKGRLGTKWFRERPVKRIHRRHFDPLSGNAAAF